MSNATSNATVGLAIDPSSLISSCELGSMGGSAAAQRYIELRTPVALVGPAAFNLPDVVAASVARSHAAAQMLAAKKRPLTLQELSMPPDVDAPKGRFERTLQREQLMPLVDLAYSETKSVQRSAIGLQ